MIVVAARTVSWSALAMVLAWSATAAPAVRHDVPLLEQRPERCGPAALSMVMEYYRATPDQVARADSAYDPVLRGALITDLAACARRAGFAARVARVSEDSLHVLLAHGVPPVLLYRHGIGPVSRGHYGVLVGWEPRGERFIVHDGTRAPRRIGRRALLERWRAAGSEALIVTPSP
jgi:ABC-type bacteriocin/lantibiotic exporter with double-glycine peptidase domain